MQAIGYGFSTAVALIDEARSKSRKKNRVLWILLLVVLGSFLAYVGYEIFITVRSYANPGWESTIDAEESQPYPAVLICPINGRNTTILPLSCCCGNVSQCSNRTITIQRPRFGQQVCLQVNYDGRLSTSSTAEHALNIEVLISIDRLLLPLYVFLSHPDDANNFGVRSMQQPAFVVSRASMNYITISKTEDYWYHGRKDVYYSASASSTDNNILATVGSLCASENSGLSHEMSTNATLPGSSSEVTASSLSFDTSSRSTGLSKRRATRPGCDAAQFARALDGPVGTSIMSQGPERPDFDGRTWSDSFEASAASWQGRSVNTVEDLIGRTSFTIVFRTFEVTVSEQVPIIDWVVCLGAIGGAAALASAALSVSTICMRKCNCLSGDESDEDNEDDGASGPTGDASTALLKSTSSARYVQQSRGSSGALPTERTPLRPGNLTDSTGL